MNSRQQRKLILLVSAGVGVTLGCQGPPLDPAEPTLAFHEVAEEVGVDFVHENGAVGDYHYPETFGAGVAWFDIDGDGWLDLYFVDGGSSSAALAAQFPDRNIPSGTERATLGNRLYRNTGASGTVHFEDLSGVWSAGDNGYGMGVVAADVDGNGSEDLYITNVGANALLLNRNARFHHTSMATDTRWGTGSAFADLDLDGDLDLIVVNYVDFDATNPRRCQHGSIRTYCDPDTYEPQGDVLYLNTLHETGRFELNEVATEVGFDHIGRSLGLLVADLDLDGDSDLYVTNDGEHNFLYRNDSDAAMRFTEVGLAAGVRFNAEGMAEAGMGVDTGDIDGDGFPDLVVANFSRETHTYYRHSGTGLRFRDVTRDVGLAQVSFLPLGFGIDLFDVDLDGDADLYSAHGHVLDKAAQIDASLSYAQPDGLYLNQGGRFVDVSATLGTAYSDPLPSRSGVSADYDGDGDLDLVVTAVGSAARLLRNDLESGQHWLGIELRSHLAGNRVGWGSRIVVRTESGSQHHQLLSGTGYLSTGPARIHIGVGMAQRVEVTVYWPGGQRQRWRDLAVDQLHRLIQERGPDN